MKLMLQHLTSIVCLALSVAPLVSPAHAQSRAAGRAATTTSAPEAQEADKLRLVSRDEIEAQAWRQKAEELRQQGDERAARSAFAEAIRRYIKIYLWETTGSRTPPPDASADERKRYRDKIATRLKDASESIDKYFELKGSGDSGLALDQLKTIQTYAKLMNEPGGPPTFFGSEVDRKAVILSKPLPSYTEEARWNRVDGSVVLRMVLTADGKVRHMFVVKGLPDGLTENAIAVANRVKFEPAIKDGQPVSQFVTLEYTFSIY